MVHIHNNTNALTQLDLTMFCTKKDGVVAAAKLGEEDIMETLKILA